MFFDARKDWKQFLNADDEENLNIVLKKAMKYRSAYKNADDIKLAQLWCAVLELSKQNMLLQKRLGRIEDAFNAMTEKIGAAEQDRKKLIDSLERF